MADDYEGEYVDYEMLDEEDALDADEENPIEEEEDPLEEEEEVPENVNVAGTANLQRSCE